MNILLVAAGLIAALILVIARTLAADEVRGRLQRRIKADVERTIESLTEELQDAWADEWRAELAAVLSMPLTAVIFARGLRQSAIKLMADTVPALSNARGGKPSGSLAPSYARPVKQLPLAALAERAFRWVATYVRSNPVRVVFVLLITASSSLAFFLHSITPIVVLTVLAALGLAVVFITLASLERHG